jgi:hypothetical protein
MFRRSMSEIRLSSSAVDEDRPILSYQTQPPKSRHRRLILVAILLAACGVAWMAQAMNVIPRQTAYQAIIILMAAAFVGLLLSFVKLR